MTTLPDITRELEQLTAAFPSPDAALVGLFVRRLLDWEGDDSSAEELVNDLQETLAGIWFSNHEKRAMVALAIARLRDLVDCIGGMGMNERVWMFGLSERWDRSTANQRLLLYPKVHADP